MEPYGIECEQQSMCCHGRFSAIVNLVARQIEQACSSIVFELALEPYRGTFVVLIEEIVNHNRCGVIVFGVIVNLD